MHVGAVRPAPAGACTGNTDDQKNHDNNQTTDGNISRRRAAGRTRCNAKSRPAVRAEPGGVGIVQAAVRASHGTQLL